ncbi:MAG TPA: hypothetical protein VJV96_04425 [Candidatus Angelobacter sp.]|nr:hypothetical protein [Candidatus Angelobacter sp.]
MSEVLIARNVITCLVLNEGEKTVCLTSVQPLASGAVSKLIARQRPGTDGGIPMKRAKKSQSKRKRTAKREVLVTETRRITTEPKVEIRKPATLAQALTEPEVAVVKPETKARVVRRTVRRAA